MKTNKKLILWAAFAFLVVLGHFLIYVCPKVLNSYVLEI